MKMKKMLSIFAVGTGAGFVIAGKIREAQEDPQVTLQNLQAYTLEKTLTYALMEHVSDDDKAKEVFKTLTEDLCKHTQVIRERTGADVEFTRDQTRAISYVYKIFGPKLTLMILNFSLSSDGKAYQAWVEEYPEFGDLYEDTRRHKALLKGLLDDLKAKDAK